MEKLDAVARTGRTAPNGGGPVRSSHHCADLWQIRWTSDVFPLPGVPMISTCRCSASMVAMSTALVLPAACCSTYTSASAGAGPSISWYGSPAAVSNCPSSTQGGDLGWITPQDCAPELAKALFLQNDAIQAVGLHPRLVHSRFGLHIVEVLERQEGRLPDFTELQAQIGARLALQSQATALRQYMQLLVGQAQVEGVELEGADTPLVQ